MKLVIYLVVFAFFWGVPGYLAWKYLLSPEQRQQLGWTIFFAFFAFLAIAYIILGLLAEALKPFGV